MRRTQVKTSFFGFVAVLGLSACTAARPTVSTPGPVRAPPAILSGTERIRADSIRHPYTEADILFMTHMIAHHAQAIVMSRMAPTHGASPSIQTLAARIINAQNDEIRAMQSWLGDRGQPVPVPDTSPASSAAAMPGMPGMTGMHHRMLMPGMLTDEQMRQLDAARGEKFDRLFLSGMIQHHRGAVQMVAELFATPGAAQDETIFKFASDVNVDQTTEIARMQKMLSSLIFEGQTP